MSLTWRMVTLLDKSTLHRGILGSLILFLSDQ
jgi:hypothetical protein